MKSLIAGVVLIVLVGFAGFLYRNVAERSALPEACTMEAKICPDGSSVGRSGPSCEFAPCAFPSVENSTLGITFVAPEGYVVGASSLTYVKPAGSVSHTIAITSYPISEGETADDVILANTRYQPADMDAEDFSRFETVLINRHEFQVTVIERFEALVHSSYFLAREADVLRFEITEHNVVDWMEPELVVDELPEHEAFIEMLGTLQLQ